MNYQEALNILETKRHYVKEGQINHFFDARMQIDANEIQNKADQFLAEMNFDAAAGSDMDDYIHQITMDTFSNSFLDYYENRSVPIENFVEHDIRSWIEGQLETLINAMIAEFDMKLADQKANQKEIVLAHQEIDLTKLEEKQNIILQSLWDNIEKKIGQVVTKH